MQDGNYGVVLSNVLMVTPDERKIKQGDYSSTLTITSEDGIDDVITDRNIQIFLVDQTIVIENLPQSGIAELYNIFGHKLVTVKGDEGKATIDCSAYQNQTLIIKATNNKEIKTIKFHL